MDCKKGREYGMSIVTMKRFRMVGLTAEQDALLQALLHIGCVEISQPDQKLTDPEWAGLLRPGSTTVQDIRENANSVRNALSALDQYAPVKSGLFTKRNFISEAEFLSPAALENGLQTASEISGHMAEINLLYGQENRLATLRASLTPWKSLDVPLALPSTPHAQITFGVCPAEVSLPQLEQSLAQEAPGSALFHAHTDRDQHYLMVICHPSEEENVSQALKAVSFSRITFQDVHGTAAESIAEIDRKMAQLAAQREVHVELIREYQNAREDLKVCADRLTQLETKELAKERLLTNGTIFFAEGWLPQEAESQLSTALAPFTCSCETADPEEGETPPTLLKNSNLVSTINGVTEMYSLPAYGSIDPNPVTFPFYVVFFGMMFADVAYGLILFLGTHIILKKFRPKGTMGGLMRLIRVCGVSTIFWGLLSGSFFSDVISVVADTFFGVPDFKLYIPVLNPVENPLPVLYLSLVLGAIQILFGMGIKAYMLIRDGHVLDAIFDVGSWWVLFAGIAVGVLTGNFIVCLIGVAMLILTQGRKKPTVFGKLGGGIGSLYDITSYLGDILSYSRLMALMLASSVIGSLVNILGALAGNIFVFLLIFAIGHAFNMGINVIGTYVHAARLQYLEFFGKFYQDGGMPFRPLTYNTRYVDIIKEES